MDQEKFSWNVNHIPFVLFTARESARDAVRWQEMLLIQRVEHRNIIHCKCANNSL